MKSLTLLISVLICARVYSQNIKLKYHNRTGFDIDSVKIGDNFITLQKDSNITFFIKEPIHLIEGNLQFPFSFGTGNIKELGKRLYITPECIPKSKIITNGTFEFEYTLRINQNGYFLFHLPPKESN